MIPHSKASLEMDGQEIELQIRANDLAYDQAVHEGDFHRAQQYRIMTDKLKAAKQQFHAMHAALFAERYGINVTHAILGENGGEYNPQNNHLSG